MKKKVFISSLVIVVVMASLYFFLREPLDRFNPWIEEEYVIVEIQVEPIDDHGRYRYKEQGVTESGDRKRVEFTTSTRLDPGTRLKVLAKGSYTIEYTLINESIS